MKIELICFTGNSGLTDYSVSLAKAFSCHVETSVVTAYSMPSRFEQLGFSVFRVFRRSRHYPFDMLRFFIGVVRRRSDWLLFQGPLKFPLIDSVFVRALRLLKRKAAVTVHDVLPHYPKPWSKLVFGVYYSSFDRVFVHSESAALGVKALGVKVPILVVPHGIYDIFNLTNVSPKQSRCLIGNLKDSDFVVLFFGHLETRKGLLEFVRASSLMQKSHPEVKFLVAGENGLADTDRIRLNAVREQPNIVVHDFRIPFEEVELYFSASNAVIMPYLEGTTSGVLKIAIAFGKPVITTTVGDFPEQVPAGGGFFINKDQNIAYKITDAILHVKRNEKQFGDAIRHVNSNQRWQDIADKMISYLACNGGENVR